MAVIFNQQVSVHAGQTISPGLTVDDTVSTVRATFTHWNGATKVGIGVQVSFDNGGTWRDIASTAPQTAPSGTFKNRTDLWIQVDNLWKLCGFTFPANSRYRPGQVCGEVYGPGQTPPETTVHSDYAFQSTIGVPYNAIVFHDPNLTPLGAGPLRQMRAILTADGNVSSPLIVDAT